MKQQDYYNDFRKYVYWLGDAVPNNMQAEAIDFLLKCPDNYVEYIIDTANPYTWKNAAEIIKKIGYPRNRMASKNIMYLFQDINWECSKTALDILNEIYIHESCLVKEILENVVKIAEKHDDKEWLFGLSYVKEALSISKTDFKNPDTVKLLFKGDYWDSYDEIT